MPIEIREIVIRAIVEDGSPSAGPGARRPQGDLDGEEIIDACVDRVLRILRRQGER